MDIQSLSKIPLLDQEQISMLVETGEDEAADLIQELLDLFIEEGEPRLDHLSSMIRAKDAEQVARDAHALAGSSSNIGALRLSKVAKWIEGEAKEGSLGSLDEFYAYMRACYSETITLLRNEISRLRNR